MAKTIFVAHTTQGVFDRMLTEQRRCTQEHGVAVGAGTYHKLKRSKRGRKEAMIA